MKEPFLKTLDLGESYNHYFVVFRSWAMVIDATKNDQSHGKRFWIRIRDYWNKLRLHVAAVLGAFALIPVLQYVVELDWRTPLADLIAIWDTTMRPTVKWLFDNTLVRFIGFFGLRIEVPLIVRDYLTAGFILLFSSLRVTLGKDQRNQRFSQLSQLYKANASDRTVIVVTGILVAIIVPAVCVLFWPLVVVNPLISVWGRLPRVGPRFRKKWEGKYQQPLPSISETLLIISPLIYLAILAAANYLILEPS